jgi:hypothetical protein
MYKRAQSTHKLPVHSAKGFANFSALLAMLPPTCPHQKQASESTPWVVAVTSSQVQTSPLFKRRKVFF